MTANSNTRKVDFGPNAAGGVVWHRLHSEREDICEALLRESSAAAHNDSPEDSNWHQELLQRRLKKLNDALDRLMSGSYGNCCQCGRWIEDTKLEFDPAVAYCIDCWVRQLTSPELAEPTTLRRPA